MSEDFSDFLIDSKLHIQTTGRNDKYSDHHHYPYEPTAYSVLDKLVDTGYITRSDVLLDYGCGMGRVPIYLREKVGCKGYGVELVKHFYSIACKNKKSYIHGADVEFIHGKAEKYQLKDDVTACFFFNPFDISILRGVVQQIKKSYEEHPRKIKMYFYYPQDEYVTFLLSIPEFELAGEVDCGGSAALEEVRNRIIIFAIG